MSLLEIPKSLIGVGAKEGKTINWSRIVPVMFDGTALSVGAREREDDYIITGAELPPLDQLRVLGIFRNTSPASSEHDVYLAGIILVQIR